VIVQANRRTAARRKARRDLADITLRTTAPTVRFPSRWESVSGRSGRLSASGWA
jgi:hypothetical protein